MGDLDPASSKTPLWRNVSFTLMWTSTAASGYGDRMIMLGALAMLGGLSKDSDSSAIQASTQFWFFLPYLVFNLVGGWLADRLPRKWMLLGCDEMRGLILLGSFFVLASLSGTAAIPKEDAWKVWVALAMIGSFAAIFNPTRNAIVPQIVKPTQLQSANAVILVINVVASMVGFLIGSRLIKPDSIESVRMGLLMGALFYLVSGTFFAFMKPTATVEQRQDSDGSMVVAIRYAIAHRKVFSLIIVNVLVWASAAVVSTGILGVLRIHHGLSGTEMLKQFGIMFPLLGLGMLVGAMVIIAIQTRRESTIVLTVALIGAGACTLIMGTVPVLLVSYLACFGVGVFGNITIISALTVLQSICPNYIRGRIMGLNAMVNTVFSVMVYAAIWRLPNADRGIVTSMSVIGPLLILGGLIGLYRYLGSGPMPSKMANAFWRSTRLFCFSWHRLQITGKHHVPGDGPVVIVSNHTTAMDPFLIQSSCVRMVRWLMLESYRVKIAKPLWRAIQPIFLDDVSEEDSAAPASKQVRQIVRELKKGDVVGVFPEGQLQYDDRDLKPFQDGAAVMAKLGKAAIVPCWIEGTVVSKRKLWHVLKPTHSRITFGPPFFLDRAMTPQEATAEIRRKVTALGNREQSTVKSKQGE